DRSKLERALADVRATYRTTDATGALKRAAQILENAARTERRVYFLSDLAQHGFGSDAPWAAGRGPELVPIAVTDGKPGANHAVADPKPERAAHLGPRGVRVSVEVATFGAEPLKELAVTLRVDGKPVAKGLVDVPAHGKATKRFFHVFQPSASEA